MQGPGYASCFASALWNTSDSSRGSLSAQARAEFSEEAAVEIADTAPDELNAVMFSPRVNFSSAVTANMTAGGASNSAGRVLAGSAGWQAESSRCSR
jgi:hypothetical protein